MMYMKKILTIFLLLLAAITASFGQKRVYLEKPSRMHRDVFVVESEDGPSLYLQFRSLFSPKDSVYIVVNEADCNALREFYQALQNTYVKWDQLARREKVKGYTKDIDITKPALLFMSRTMLTTDYDWRPFASLPQYLRTSSYSVAFEVDRDGGTHVVLHIPLFEDHDTAFYISSKNEFDGLILKTDWNRQMRRYEKLIPKHTKEELDKMFVE